MGRGGGPLHSEEVVPPLTSSPRLLLVMALALSVRLAWVVTLPPALVWPDEQEFVTIARHLAASDGYVSASYRANPVLPLYLAGVFRVFGESYLAARVGQAIVGALTCVVIAATATRLLGAQVGFVSGLLLAIYLPQVYLSGVFYAECLFTFLIAVTVHCAVRSRAGRDAWPWLLATGTSFALSALTRPIFLAYLPFLAAALVLPNRADGVDRDSLARRLAMGAALVVATGVVLLPWTLRNYFVLGRPVVVSTGFGTKLWQGNNEGAVGDADDRELSPDQEVWKARVATLPAPERAVVAARYRDAERRIAALQAESGDLYAATDAVLGPLAVEFIRSHPLRTLELFVRKLGTLLLPFSKTLITNGDTTIRNRLLATAAYLPILALALVGFWRSRGRTVQLWIVYGLLGSIAAAYAVLTACTRFRLPLDPYLVIFAATALAELRGTASVEVGEERPGLAAYAPHGAAVGHHQPITDHARARRLETDR